MKYVIGALSVFLIPIAVNGILLFLRKSKKAKEGKVCLPGAYALIGGIGFSMFFACAVVSAFTEQVLWVSALFLAISLVGLSLLVAFVNCRITYDENGIVSKNFFGIKRRFTYDQMTALREEMQESFVYFGKKKIAVDRFAAGGYEFLAYAEMRYKKIHGVASVPRVKNKGVFKGNVNDAGGFLAVYSIVGVVFLGFLVAMICIYLIPASPSTTEERRAVFVSCSFDQKKGVSATLKATTGDSYVVRYPGDVIDELRKLCDGKTEATVYSGKTGKNVYQAKSIVWQGKTVLSFEETNRILRRIGTPAIILVAVINLLWWAFVALSVIVGRNPRKFSKKTVRLFFRDGYINR